MAGAGYKLFQTGAVLTASDVNTYLNEQAVMRFANAAARTTALSGVLAEGMVSYLMDTNAVEVYDGSAWVGVATGDITSVTAGTGLSGGGTSGAVTLSLTAPVTEVNGGTNQTTYTTGDLLYASGSNTLAKRSIGTTGQVLTVSGGLPTWSTPATSSSGLTYITQANPSASAATNVDNCFTSTYSNYLITYYLTATTTSNNRLGMRMRASGSDLTSNYKNAGSYTNGASGAIGFNDLETGYIMLSQNDSGAPYMAYGSIEVIRPQAADYTRLIIKSSGYNGTSQFSYDFRTFVNNTTSYDGFTVYIPSGNVTGNFRVYGYANS